MNNEVMVGSPRDGVGAPDGARYSQPERAKAAEALVVLLAFEVLWLAVLAYGGPGGR